MLSAARTFSTSFRYARQTIMREKHNRYPDGIVRWAGFTSAYLRYPLIIGRQPALGGGFGRLGVPGAG